MRRKRIANSFALAAVLAALLTGLFATPSQAVLRHIDGTVISKDSAKRTFKLSTQSGTVRIKVNDGTEFERISGGFGGLHKGLKIEVDARTSNNGLVAIQVEPQGGGGSGGGGGDDNGGHGNDDGPGHT
jgi:hypothetical protein